MHTKKTVDYLSNNNGSIAFYRLIQIGHNGLTLYCCVHQIKIANLFMMRKYVHIQQSTKICVEREKGREGGEGDREETNK